LMQARNELLGMIAQDSRLVNVRPNSLDDVPEYRLQVDWEHAGSLGLPINLIHSTISSAFGGAYANDFLHGGRVKRVYVQADAKDRMLPEDIDKLYVRNNSGQMVPFSAFSTGHWTYGPQMLQRFNATPAINIVGEAARGLSSGDAMLAMEELVRQLPAGFDGDWQGVSYQERQSGSQAPVLYAFSIL